MKQLLYQNNHPFQSFLKQNIMEPVVLITCPDPIEANILKGAIENAGIECFLSEANPSAIFPSTIGDLDGAVAIYVDEKDLAKAQQVIQV